jgi:hypothetical protein
MQAAVAVADTLGQILLLLAARAALVAAELVLQETLLQLLELLAQVEGAAHQAVAALLLALVLMVVLESLLFDM